MTASEYLADLGACFTTTEATQSGYGDKSVDLAMGDLCWWVHSSHGVVHLIGNGGSASVVAHVQNDLIKACGIKALVHQDIPLLTAYANDNGYPKGYTDALKVWLHKGDILIAVSSSGMSPNIVNAAHAAKDVGATVVTLSGFEASNPLRKIGHLNFYVPSSDYGQVELTHAALLHCLTDRLASK